MQKEYQVADTRTSNLSAVNIGHNTVTDRHKTLRKIFKEEAQEIGEFTKGIHYSRKDCYMQTAYASTVSKMSDCQARSSGLDRTKWPSNMQSVEKPPTLESTSPDPVKRMKYKEFVENMNSQVNQEYSLNERRLRYNKDCGTKARVDEIITNKPLPPGADNKVYLFPEKASHTQCLVITGNLSMPDPRIPPPDVPRRRRDPDDIIG